ncbi:MAG: CRISPR-associated endonuclease Cas3'' [Hydrogenobacter sp.]
MENLLRKRWAKSNGTTIREHTDRLKENLKVLRELYGDRIACPEEFRHIFWQALELACEYHDWGKLHWAFQRNVVKNERVESLYTPEVRHNLLSPAFLPNTLIKTLKSI